MLCIRKVVSALCSQCVSLKCQLFSLTIDTSALVYSVCVHLCMRVCVSGSVSSQTALALRQRCVCGCAVLLAYYCPGVARLSVSTVQNMLSA